MPVAIVTGASRGLGHATSRALAARGWSLVIDARGAEALDAVARELAPADVIAMPGDVRDPGHRQQVVDAAARLGPLQLVVNNASLLGPSPQPALSRYPLGVLATVFEVNVIAPLGLIQLTLPALVQNAGTVLNISSDAAVEAYEGWGGYGSSKAALDHLTAILAAENPAVAMYALDPGDMRTEMQQQAFPGDDISDRPEPDTVVPALLRLLDERPDSGRYQAAQLLTPAGAP
jgi:NAD(P)-dependent dehydrogenase (short-subunit alcohol dehydrogenase family)